MKVKKAPSEWSLGVLYASSGVQLREKTERVAALEATVRRVFYPTPREVPARLET